MEHFVFVLSTYFENNRLSSYLHESDVSTIAIDLDQAEALRDDGNVQVPHVGEHPTQGHSHKSGNDDERINDHMKRGQELEFSPPSSEELDRITRPYPQDVLGDEYNQDEHLVTLHYQVKRGVCRSLIHRFCHV